MTKDKTTIKDEFKMFGENLKTVINSAWQSEQSQQIQNKLNEEIGHLGDALNELVSSLSNSEAGQRFQQEVDDFGERLRSGEVEAKAKAEFISVLQKLNQELEKANEYFHKPEHSS